MAELNKFALYSINQQNQGLLFDITESIHKNLEGLSEYNEVKTYINKKFGDFNNPGDNVGFNFEKMNKSILCNMGEDKSIMVLCRNNRSKNIDWVYLKLPK